ncbi:MAG: AAA family ATPase [Isosphaeraceae bacterium]
MRRIGSSLIPDWFTAHDAWILARLWTGMAKPSDLSDASADFRPIATRMLAAPVANRQAIAEEWLRGCADAEAIRLAVIESDPSRPMPAKGPAVRGKARKARASDIKPQSVEWLWRRRVPLGMLTMFAGDPKLGKSYVTLTLAAAVSQGAPMPDGDVPDGPASVLIMSAEDDPSRTIVPRLIAAGADLSKVHILGSIERGNGVEWSPSLNTDLQAIEEAAAELGDCRLILIDPISAYLGGVDDYRNAELRQLLAPLGDVAARLRSAVVLVSHLSKGGGANGKHRVMGSIAYVGVCRANAIFVRDPTDAAGRRVLLCDNGGNLAPPAPTLAYTIEELLLGPAVVFHPEPVPITTEQALGDEVQHAVDRHQAPERREAEIWLKEILAAGPMPAREVEEAAKRCGIAGITLKRAKLSIGVVVTRSGFGKGAVYSWALPVGSPEKPQTP